MESVKFAGPVDNDEWKKQKNYGPAALFTVLLLGTAFLAGKSYATYGSNGPTPTGSLLAMGGTLGRCAHMAESGGAPFKCPPGQEFWSVSPIVDEQKCLFDTGTTQICGDLCVGINDSEMIDFFANSAPDPKPKRGSCRSLGYQSDTGKNIVPLPFMPSFKAYIYTK